MDESDPYHRLLAGREHDPFRILGLQRSGAKWCVRVYRPHATEVRWGRAGRRAMQRVHAAGIFEWRGNRQPSRPWQIRVDGKLEFDAYAFPPTPSPLDLYLFSEGRNAQSYRFLGAFAESRLAVPGVTFRVWAPNAERVSVVGDFNQWDGRTHTLSNLGASGVWELFIPELEAHSLYKFEIRPRDSGAVLLRADPYARAAQLRPQTASIVATNALFAWRDHHWLQSRQTTPWTETPINIYELHAGSWLRHPDGRFYHYAELAARLLPYLSEQGFTHLELMPLTEHPLDESWGYQTTGYFAPTARYGSAEDLKTFIDDCHAAHIGVILDWVPAHFPADDGALAHFDGSHLYEHPDPRVGRHPDWGTYIFNYGRREVMSFLLSSAHYWLAEFHFDGLRVDAVASMLYLDYSRGPGQWLPNRYGGRENLDAVAFLKSLNELVHAEFPGVLMCAEESTTWPGVTQAPAQGGLGFSLKWNMGWMNDTLRYFALDPVYRRFHHHWLTFGRLYAYSEKFLLPLSHDEVVHGKRSLLNKMPGDEWQRFANLRLLRTYQMTMPGKKLCFMGNEFGQVREWRVSGELDWDLLQAAPNTGLRHLFADLNHLYRAHRALHELDLEASGFDWLECDDAERSLLSFIRRDRAGGHVVVILNFTPVPRHDLCLRVPRAHAYRELFNSDSTHYGGANSGNLAVVPCQDLQSATELSIFVPALAGLILAPDERGTA
ncbi:MAG: 1,4-alpha-glucan branching protein GlgB [Gammaproteobacteria bacterium]